MDKKQNILPFIAFIESYSGMTLPEVNYRTLEDFIEWRLNELQCSREEYIGYLQSQSSESKKERELLFNTISITESYFFREEKHFILLENYLFPELKKRGVRDLKIWSAACASGEEALSLIFTADTKWKKKDFSVQLYASDINTDALAFFKRGEYAKKSFRKDGSRYHNYLYSMTEKNRDVLNNNVKALSEKNELSFPLKIKQDILKQIQMKKINLWKEISYPKNYFHIIFLRNLLIYYNEENKNKLISKILPHLKTGGFLILSVNEIPHIKNEYLQSCQKDNIWYFQKR